MLLKVLRGLKQRLVTHPWRFLREWLLRVLARIFLQESADFAQLDDVRSTTVFGYGDGRYD